MVKSNPRVSICIPAYNRADMVGRAIESALNQTFRDLEVIVLDDGSTDNIDEVVTSYQDARLKFVKNNENIGQFASFNRCIQLSRGEFIHILHSDDSIDNTFSETCVTFFDSHPGVVLTFTASVNKSEQEIHEQRYADSNLVIPAPEGFLKLLRTWCFIPCTSVMVRREVYKTSGRFSLDFSYAGDYYQWMKIARLYDIAYINDTAVYYHEGEHSETFKLTVLSPSGYIDRIRIIIRTIADLEDEYPEYAADINVYLKRLILKYLVTSLKWKKKQTKTDPNFFIGLAYSALSLVQAGNAWEKVKKPFYFLLIAGLIPVILIPPFRHLAAKAVDPLVSAYHSYNT